MTIGPGTRVGPYEVTALVGEGAMGKVWRAHHAALKRDEALKVLPDAFITDPERLARFEREAQILASLNHPNIAHVYGFEAFDGGKALAMELVEGPTLADCIAEGPLPVAKALPIATQIAEALEAAHERGIVHRDLKPANIKLRNDGTVKVLDFGLAKALEPLGTPIGAVAAALTESPTITSPAVTRAGVVLGTAAYMSPEQATGKAVDTRADIWAFGCIVFEMLTGRHAFARGSVTETLAAVLERQPDWRALPDSTPASVRRLLRRCLEKEPKHRLHAIADARLDLEDAPHDAAVASRHGSRPLLWLAAVFGCVISLGVGWLLGTRSAPPTPAVSRWLLDVRPATTLLGANPDERSEFGRTRPSRTALALSPDGRSLVFTAERDGTTRLYVRALDKAEASVIAGTDGADGPFFSPDGNWVGFWASGAIRKVALAGGPAVKVCDTALPYGSTWSPGNAIVFASRANGTIWSVDAAGGMPRALTKLEAGEFNRVLPQILPNGKWLLFTVVPATGDWDRTRLVAQSLDTGEQKVLLEGAADARYVPTGHLVYVRLGNLMAAPFDADRAQLTGPEVGMIEGVMQSVNSTVVPLDTGAGQYTFSSAGTFAYVAGDLHPDFEGLLYSIRRGSSPESIPTPPRAFGNPRLSPDGRQVAVASWGLRDRNLWRIDLAEGTLTRLTTEGRAGFPVWSADGMQILFALGLTGPPNLFSVGVDGGAPKRLGQSDLIQFPGSWTPDGKSVAYQEGEVSDIKILSVDSDGRGRPLVGPTRFNESTPEISPDGRWLAYVSDETSRNEVYVQSFPDLGRRRQISRTGGVNPAWSANGRTLTFLTRPDPPQGRFMQMMEVDVTLGATFTATSPRPLFEPLFTVDRVRAYDLTSDAGRFIFIRETFPPATSAPREIHVIQNWFEELKRLAPTN